MAPARMDPWTPGTPLIVRIAGPLSAVEVAELCGQVRALLAAAAVEEGGVVCHVEPEVDLGVVDLLARLRLLTDRVLGSVHVVTDENCGARLAELLEQVGLSDVVPAGSETRG